MVSGVRSFSNLNSALMDVATISQLELLAKASCKSLKRFLVGLQLLLAPPTFTAETD